MKNNILLIGFMGTGKSTVSKKLAFLTKYREVDLDEYIEQYAGKTMNEIFAESGEEEFRRLETICLEKVVSGDDSIISCGGGTAIKPENVQIMQNNGSVVWLTASPKTIYERVKDSTNRPILNGNMNVEYIESLMKKRESYYANAATVIVATDGKNTDEISREILEKIKKNS